MAEEPARQGWRVPQRGPVFAAAATLALVVMLLAIAAHAYTRLLRPHREQPVTAFPAPGLETFVHDGRGDPPRLRPARAADPTIEAAKRRVVAEGLTGWP